jgi:hypothetical protein
MNQIEPGNRLEARGLKGARDVISGMIANSTDRCAQLCGVAAVSFPETAPIADTPIEHGSQLRFVVVDS